MNITRPSMANLTISYLDLVAIDACELGLQQFKSEVLNNDQGTYAEDEQVPLHKVIELYPYVGDIMWLIAVLCDHSGVPHSQRMSVDQFRWYLDVLFTDDLSEADISKQFMARYEMYLDAHIAYAMKDRESSCCGVHQAMVAASDEFWSEAQTAANTTESILATRVYDGAYLDVAVEELFDAGKLAHLFNDEVAF